MMGIGKNWVYCVIYALAEIVLLEISFITSPKAPIRTLIECLCLLEKEQVNTAVRVVPWQPCKGGRMKLPLLASGNSVIKCVDTC
jgi:hypothetical protein